MFLSLSGTYGAFTFCRLGLMKCVSLSPNGCWKNWGLDHSTLFASGDIFISYPPCIYVHTFSNDAYYEHGLLENIVPKRLC